MNGIRAAESQDAAAIISLWQACGLTRPWNDPQADFDRAIAHETSVVLIARDGDAITGSVMVGDDGHRGWVYYLGVAPGARSSGLGKALMAAAEEWLRERNCPKIQLMVRTGNDAASGFYAALGYDVQPVETWGRRLDITA
jgi:ribosomal protein S18 acetylase RimI-like enzyme